MRQLKGEVISAIALALMLMATLLLHPALSLSAEQEKEPKVTYDGQNLSVSAEDADAVGLFEQIAKQANFKLVTTGFPENVKLSVNFTDLPLEKGVERVIKTLSNKASVSHVAVYNRKGEKDVLYSLRVTYSGGTRQVAGPAMSAPTPKAKAIQPTLPTTPIERAPASKVEKERDKEREAEEQKRQLRQEVERELIERLRQSGWSEEEIMENIQMLRREKE